MSIKLTDLTGCTFNNWTVLNRVPKDSSKGKQEVAWVCRCKCGNTKNVLGKTLKNGTSKSCGCLAEESCQDLVGRKFGYLSVCKLAPKKKPFQNSKWSRRSWECLCVCGNTKIVTENALLHGKNTSCGCKQIQNDLDRASNLGQKNRKFSIEISTAKDIYRDRYDDGDITLEKFMELSQGNCYYCDEPPSNYMNCRAQYRRRKIEGGYRYNGLDRLDSSKLHTLDNVVACCKNCNYAKRVMSVEEFKSWITKIYEHLKRDTHEK